MSKSKKQVAVVTGAANGIGEAVARLFSSKGYAVVMLDVSDRGNQVCDEIKAGGGNCAFWQCDVAKEKDVASTVEKVMKMHGRIDVLNNNAGIVLVRPLDEIRWEEYQRVVDVNLGGIFLFCKHVIPVMKRQKKGSIVNMGSVSGHVGQVDHSLYGATKGAVIALTRALAWELAPYGIHHCGNNLHLFAKSYATLPSLVFVDVGWGSDVAKCRKELPDAFLNLRLSPVRMLQQSAQEIRQDTERLLAAHGSARNVGVCCINMDYRTPDENVRAMMEKARSQESEVRSQNQAGQHSDS